MFEKPITIIIQHDGPKILPWVVDNIIETCKSVHIADFSSGRKTTRNHSLVNEFVPLSRSIDTLVAQVRADYFKEYLVVDGAELLIDSFEGEETIVRQFSDLNLHVWEEGQLAWASLVEVTRKLQQSLGPTKLVLIINAGEEAESTVQEHFQEKDDVRVIIVKSPNGADSLQVRRDLLFAIKTMDLDEALAEIKTRQDALPQHEIERFRAFAHIRHGGRSKAMEYLESILPHLSSNDQLLLAELYWSVNKWSAAFSIGRRLFDENRFTLGVTKILLKSLLGALRSSEVLDSVGDEEDVLDLVNTIVLVDSENPEVLDLAADCLDYLTKYTEAARLRRLLWNRTNEPIHECLARFLDLKEHPLPDRRSAEGYILEWADKYPDIKDRAFYWLGAYLRSHYDSTYKAFEYWAKVSRSLGSTSAYDAAVGRMMLLEDNIIAAQALRLKDNEIGREKLITRKTTELVQNMELLSTRDKGYLVWEDFLLKAYTAQTWKMALLGPIVDQIEVWNKSVTDDQISSSYLYRVSREALDSHDETNPMNYLHLLRELKVKNSPTIDDPAEIWKAIKMCLVHIDRNGDDLQKVWARYQDAILSSLHGRDQDAINQSLSLFHIANHGSSPSISQVSRMLGFMALANAQYRLGQIVPGIACLVVGMRLSLELGELGAMFEEGRSLIHRFLLDEAVMPTLAQRDKLAIQTFFDKFSHGLNDLLASTNSAFLTHDFERIYATLHDTVYSQGVHDLEWAIHLTSFINACGQTNRIQEGRALILQHADQAIKLLSQRQDRLPNLILLWSQFLVHFDEESGQAIKCLRLARRLLRTGVEAVTGRRQTLHYRLERSHVSELHRELYLQYVEVLALVHTLQGFSAEESMSALQDLLTYLPHVNPRSILENRKNQEEISDELIGLEREYRALFDEISGLDHVDSHSELVIRYNNLHKELIERHPHYRALPTLPEYPISDIQHFLKDDELFVQYVVTRHGMVTLTMNQNEHNIALKLMPTGEYRARIRLLGQALQAMEVPTSESKETLRSLCAGLSVPIMGPLLDALSQMPGNEHDSTVYVCPDLSLEMFSSNLLATDESWLLEKVGRLVTVLDFVQLIERPKAQSVGKHLRTVVTTLGSQADNAVNKARSKILTWSHRPTLSHIDLKNNNDEIETLLKNSRQLSPDVIVMIGHGLPDEISGPLSGATGILGFKHTIWGDDLRRLRGLAEHLVLLTCSSGAPYQGQVESSTGVWSAVLSENFYGVILCRWDVNVTATLELLDQMLSIQEQQPITLGETLAKAQRAMLRAPQWAHPYYWAGLEYWGH